MINEKRRILLQQTQRVKLYTIDEYLTATTKYGKQDLSQGTIAYNALINRSGTIIPINNTTSNSIAGDNVFNSNSGLHGTFFVKKQTWIGASTFIKCSNLEYIVMPSCNTVYTAGASTCTKLKGVDFGGSPSSSQGFIRTNAFGGCTALKTLILRGSTVWRLDYTTVFNNTPFASGKTGGTLYVPQDLISSYETATNWDTILGYENNQILPIEDSIYETKYVNGDLIGGN